MLFIIFSKRALCNVSMYFLFVLFLFLGVDRCLMATAGLLPSYRHYCNIA